MTSILPSLALGLGLFLIFIARQVLGEGVAQDAVLWTGVAVVLGSTGWRAYEWNRRAKGPAQQVELWLLVAHGGVLLSLGLYALSTEWGLETLGAEGEDDRTGAVLYVLWPAVLACSVLALAFMEAAYRRMPIAEAVELRRVRGAAFDGLSIAFALIFVVSMNFVANERDVRKDFAYFKTTAPSEGTIDMVEGLGTDVQAVLFFPQVNEVLDQVRPYFERIDRASDKLSIRVVDHALAPELARKHRVQGNGFVALLKGEGETQQAQTFEIGADLETARRNLRRLDGTFQENLARLVKQRRELAFTAGHRERTTTGAEGDEDGLKLRQLQDALERSNITVRPLGMAQGLANDVPEDTPAVAVMGPREPFLPEEAQSLLRYLSRGGRVAVLIDPNEEHGMEPLLEALGLKMQEGVLASERQHLRRTFTQADRGLVYTNRYTSHPTVTLASRNAARLATVFVQGGALARNENPAEIEGARVTFPVRSGGQTWLDLDGDWERDDNEPIAQHEMIAAVTVPNEGEGEEGRAVVIADADFVTDQVIRNPGNALVFGDTIQWLIGEEEIVGPPESEEDVPIEHTRDEDKIWFYATSFGVPLPLLGVGVWVATRRKRRARTERADQRPEKKEEPPKAEPAPVKNEEPPAEEKKEEA